MTPVFANYDYGWTAPEYITVLDSYGNTYGDNNYLKNVFSYLGDNDTITFLNIPQYDNEGNVLNDYNYVVTVSNSNEVLDKGPIL